SRAVHSSAGQVIEIPYMGALEKTDRADLSLLELRSGNFIADRLKHISIKSGLLQIKDLPPGDYSLLVKPDAALVQLRVTEGNAEGGYALGSYRKLEVRNAKPLQLERVEVGDKKLTVRMVNASPFARVHVFARRFQPAYSAYGTLAKIVAPEPHWRTVPRAQSQYIAGRDIGDEYRYIIERKFARKYPGNML